MAFDLNGINRVSAGANTNAPAVMAYATSVDTGAQVGGAGYFNDFVENLRIGTIILVKASDGTGFYQVTALNPNVTMVALATIGVGGVGAAQLAADAVTTAAILNANVTSAKLEAPLVHYSNTLITAAQWNGMYAAPKEILAAPGANLLYVVSHALLEVDYGGAQFAAGGVVALQYAATINGGGIKASDTIAAATVNAWAADNIAFLNGAGTGLATAVNKSLCLSNATGAFTTGTSDINLHLWYSVVTTAL